MNPPSAGGFLASLGLLSNPSPSPCLLPGKQRGSVQEDRGGSARPSRGQKLPSSLSLALPSASRLTEGRVTPAEKD